MTTHVKTELKADQKKPTPKIIKLAQKIRDKMDGLRKDFALFDEEEKKEQAKIEKDEAKLLGRKERLKQTRLTVADAKKEFARYENLKIENTSISEK